MVKVIQLGCGITGLVCAEELARNDNVTELVLADSMTDGAESLAARLRSDKVSVTKIDVRDRRALRKLVKGADAVVSSLPWELNSQVLRTAADVGTNYVDFCMTVEALADFDAQDRLCRDAGIAALTSMGLEPGISDTFARYTANMMDSVEEVHVMDGDNGVIEGHEFASTWSPVDWIEEVTVPAAVFRNGRIEYVPPLHEREVYDFPPPIGPLPVYKTLHDETFLIPKHIRGVRNADFRIAVDDNFAKAARMLRKLGLHSKEPVDVKGVKVRPLDLLAALMPRPVDIADKIKGHGGTVVEVIGERDGERTKMRTWTIVSHEEAYRRSRTNATGFLVGIGGAVPTEMLVEGKVKDIGLLVPEQLRSEEFVGRLRKKGLKVNQEITRIPA